MRLGSSVCSACSEERGDPSRRRRTRLASDGLRTGSRAAAPMSASRSAPSIEAFGSSDIFVALFQAAPLSTNGASRRRDASHGKKRGIKLPHAKIAICGARMKCAQRSLLYTGACTQAHRVRNEFRVFCERKSVEHIGSTLFPLFGSPGPKPSAIRIFRGRPQRIQVRAEPCL